MSVLLVLVVVVVVVVVVVEVVVVVVVEAFGFGFGSGSLEAFGFGSGSLEAFVVVAAFVAFVACAVAVAAKTAVVEQGSNSLKMAVALVQEPKWAVAFAAAVMVALAEPDSRDASLPLKWKPNYSLV
jgi:hypothetical protein